MRRGVVWVVAAAVVQLASVSAIAAAALGPARVVSAAEVPAASVALVSIVLGALVLRGAPRSPVGPALAWSAAATSAVRAVEVWGLTAGSLAPWWGSGVAGFVGPGFWPWQLMGFFALVLVFPDGLLPGRRWRTVAVLGPVAALVINVAKVGTDPADMPPGWQVPLLLAGLGLLLVALGGAVAAVVVRFRRGDEVTRRQLLWVLLAVGSVPALLAASWVLVEVGVPEEVAYSGFLLAILVLVPAAVTVAVLRHDLFDIERLVSGSVTVLLTAVVSAGVFAVAVWLLGSVLAGPAALGSTGAAFVTALCLLPVYHRLQTVVARITERERTVALAGVRAFVEQVRDGAAEPEEVESVLRVALGDPDVRLHLVLPGHPGFVDLLGAPVHVAAGAETVSLRAQGVEVGVVVLGRGSARRRRLASEAARAARLPIEVSRLRLGLRAALADVMASRARVVTGVTEERRRLQRDLHDGAQQHVLAVGMRLRSLQRRVRAGSGGVLGAGEVHDELDRVVAAVEGTVAELRRIAHGVRPSRLDDGLAAALGDLALDSPVPLHVEVGDVPDDLDDTTVTTAYFVVAEAVANAWKHAQANRVSVAVGPCDGRVRLVVSDDGRGGVDPSDLTALQDRVASVGGHLDVASPVGAGTRITAVI